jgi:elastase-2
MGSNPEEINLRLLVFFYRNFKASRTHCTQHKSYAMKKINDCTNQAKLLFPINLIEISYNLIPNQKSMKNILLKIVIGYLILNLNMRKGLSIKVDVHYIIGGSDAELGEFPYQALLYTTRIENSRPNRYLCGGSLLNSEWVLTAGHCIVGASKIEVVLGITDRLKYGKNGISQTAKKWFLHEKYQPFSFHSTLANDVALVQLEKKLEENEYIQYIDLETDPKAKYSKGMISGWGKTYDAQSSGTTHLQYGEVKIISNSRCSSAYPKLRASTVCVVSLDPHKVEAPCNGDSGNYNLYNTYKK